MIPFESNVLFPVIQLQQLQPVALQPIVLSAQPTYVNVMPIPVMYVLPSTAITNGQTNGNAVVTASK
jgi:hypothetical protein